MLPVELVVLELEAVGCNSPATPLPLLTGGWRREWGCHHSRPRLGPPLPLMSLIWTEALADSCSMASSGSNARDSRGHQAKWGWGELLCSHCPSFMIVKVASPCSEGKWDEVLKWSEILCLSGKDSSLTRDWNSLSEVATLPSHVPYWDTATNFYWEVWEKATCRTGRVVTTIFSFCQGLWAVGLAGGWKFRELRPWWRNVVWCCLLFTFYGKFMQIQMCGLTDYWVHWSIWVALVNECAMD